MQSNDSEDSVWVERLTKGDTSAFSKIYYKYAPQLFAYARNKISSTEDCQELVQEVFETLLKQRHQLYDNGLRYFLFWLIKNKVIRYFQHEKVINKYAEHYRFSSPVYDQWREETIDTSTEEFNRWLEKNIAALPDRCREAFTLRLHHRLSNGEVAERMGISKATVERHIYDATQLLRKAYMHLIKAIGFLMLATAGLYH